MALATLMTLPTPGQRASWAAGAEATVVGAHTVGLPDGGPGLPVLGWSTVGGDLRIPHFVGMHALQLLPLLLLALELLALRLPALRDPRRRFRLIVVAVAGYAAALAIITGQALSGQSVVAPAGAILVAGVTVAALTGLAAVVVLVAPVGSGAGGARGGGGHLQHPVH
jgi:hypothetical protein